MNQRADRIWYALAIAASLAGAIWLGVKVYQHEERRGVTFAEQPASREVELLRVGNGITSIIVTPDQRRGVTCYVYSSSVSCVKTDSDGGDR